MMFQNLKTIGNNMNLLFICECNCQRSPTFEKFFRDNKPEYEVRSSGTSWAYPDRLTEELLKWADHIYVMDLEQHMFLSRKFPEYLYKTRVIGCSDQYPRESPQLYRLIEYWAKRENL